MLYLEYIGLLSFFRSLYSCVIHGAEREEEAFEGFELKDHSAATRVPHEKLGSLGTSPFAAEKPGMVIPGRKTDPLAK